MQSQLTYGHPLINARKLGLDLYNADNKYYLVRWEKEVNKQTIAVFVWLKLIMMCVRRLTLILYNFSLFMFTHFAAP